MHFELHFRTFTKFLQATTFYKLLTNNTAIPLLLHHNGFLQLILITINSLHLNVPRFNTLIPPFSQRPHALHNDDNNSTFWASSSSSSHISNRNAPRAIHFTSLALPAHLPDWWLQLLGSRMGGETEYLAIKCVFVESHNIVKNQ